MADRALIVNADDFGQSPEINAGVVECFERGIVTSTSLMVRWPSAADAAAYGRAHPELSVGLHLDLGEWVYREGEWSAWYEVIDPDDPDAVEAEVGAQLARFRSLMGRDPTHVDGHQHVHLAKPARSVITSIARALGIPVRGCTESVGYRGDFYGMSGKGEPYPEAITEEALCRFIDSLPAGVTEMGCHPGIGVDPSFVYAAERDHEVAALCSAAVRDAVEAAGVRLVSYADVGRTQDHDPIPAN